MTSEPLHSDGPRSTGQIRGGPQLRLDRVLPRRRRGPQARSGLQYRRHARAEAYLARTCASCRRRCLVTFLRCNRRHFHRTDDYPGTSHADDGGAVDERGAGARRTAFARGRHKKLVMVRDHGGNSAAMTRVAQDLRRRSNRASGGADGWSRRSAGRIFSAKSAPRHHGRPRSTFRSCGCDLPEPVRKEEAIARFSSQTAFCDRKKNIAGCSTQGRGTVAGRRRTACSGAAGMPPSHGREGRAVLAHGARPFLELLGRVDNLRREEEVADGPINSPSRIN